MQQLWHRSARGIRKLDDLYLFYSQIYTCDKSKQKGYRNEPATTGRPLNFQKVKHVACLAGDDESAKVSI